MNAPRFHIRRPLSRGKPSTKLLEGFFMFLVLALGSAALSASPVLAGPLPFVRTVLVTGAGTPLANGTALLNAISGIASGPNVRWLIRLEPGIFDLGTSTLDLKNFVDVEGSGRDVTTIRSKVSGNPVINYAAGINAEVRDLTVQALPPSGQAFGVIINSAKALLSRVNVMVTGTTSVLGVSVSGSGISPVLSDVAVTAGFSSSTITGTVTGFHFQQSRPIVRNSSVSISTPNSQNVGVFEILGAAATIDGLQTTISGSLPNFGIWITQGCSLKLTRGNVVVSGFQASGIDNEGGGTVEVSNSSVVASASSPTGGFGIREVRDPGTVVIEHSVIQGSDTSIASFSASTFRVAMSRLVNPISNNNPQATFTCVGVYNQNFVPLNAGCL